MILYNLKFFAYNRKNTCPKDIRFQGNPFLDFEGKIGVVWHYSRTSIKSGGLLESIWRSTYRNSYRTRYNLHVLFLATCDDEESGTAIGFHQSQLICFLGGTKICIVR